jgi:hypothetical protein
MEVFDRSLTNIPIEMHTNYISKFQIKYIPVPDQFVWSGSSGLRGHKRTYLTILESTDHALLKMVRYVLLRPLRPELDAKTKTCLAAKTRFCHLDEQANSIL